jgi:hypothetical protein
MRDALVCRLLAYHAGAGFAAEPIGVLAVSGSEVIYELVPSDIAEGWACRLRDAGSSLDADAVRAWQRQANGVSWVIDVTEVNFDGTGEGLRALVWSAFEELLVERALMREELP